MNWNSTLKTLTVLALIMHLMVQVTPLWMPKAGTSIQICSGQDVRTIQIDENGNEIPAAPSIPKEHCSFCLASGIAGKAINAESCAFTVSLINTKTDHIQFLKAEYTPIKTKANLSRGPPVLS